MARAVRVRSSDRLGRQVAATLAAASVMTLSAACAGTPTTTTDAASASSAVVPTTSSQVAGDECAQAPPKGAIDRSGHDLRFPVGSAHIAVSKSTVNDDAQQQLPTQETPATQPTPAADADCYRFDKWGNPAPDVPPDSLQFLFKGSPSTGAQIEFFVGDLTGGVLPPIGDERPRVGPLTGPITSNIGVSTDGVWYQATRCSLHLTAMSTARGAGWFTCPAAAATTTNPFDPSDDVPYDADETSTTPTVPGAITPSTPAPSPTKPGVIITGWFDVTPR